MDASDLINTKLPAPHSVENMREARQSWDYYYGRPYPAHAFNEQQWPTRKGPFPTPLPYASVLINESAEIVFGNSGPTFSVPDIPDANDFLQDVIKRNRLKARWISLAQMAANQGSVAAKFSYDGEDERCPIRISFLSVPNECRVWTDPHDRTRILMARVQYPYRAETGNWFYFREEWTDTQWITYHPRSAGTNTSGVGNAVDLPGYAASFGDISNQQGEAQWEIDKQVTNPFGIIPLVLIQNKIIEGSPLGAGDVWGNFRLIDRIALTMHGEDRHNQSSRGTPVFKNAEIENDGQLLPDEPISVKNKDGSVAADFDIIEPAGAWRVHSQWDIGKWEALLYKNAGVSLVDVSTITNKGNMTELALRLTYARSIATSDRKRTAWGDDGLCVLFQNMLWGLSNVGAVRGMPKIPESVDVTCTWSDYFAPTDADIESVSTRTTSQVSSGLLAPEDGARRVAVAEGVPDDEVDDVVTRAMAAKHATFTDNAADVSLPDKDSDTESDPDESGGSQSQSEISESSGSNNFTA